MSETNPFVHVFSVDLKLGSVAERERRPLSQGDAFADKIVVNVQSDGTPVLLENVGVMAKVIRADGQTVPLVGAVEGGAACVTLDAACYAVPGEVRVSVALSAGDMVQTVLVLMLNVETSETGVIVDNGVLSDLSATLGVLAELKTVMETFASSIVTEASGAVATIADAAARDAQGLVTTIKPDQAGTGTPSPTNVRVISARDKISLYHGEAYDESAAATLTATLPEGVYGGTLDWLTGVLTVTHEAITYDGTEEWTYAAANSICSLKNMPTRFQIGNQEVHHVCSHYRSRVYAAGASQTDKTCYTVNTTTLMVKDTTMTSLEDWTAYLAAQAAAGTPMTIVWLLKPARYKTIQLTPQQLALLKGGNAIWSDAGDTAVTYIADTKMYIDNRLDAIAASIINA